MCLYTKYVPNRTRIISRFHNERYLVPIKCGRCSECLREMHNEWYFRIYHEWLSTLENGGYIFFDTLTYKDEFLPHISDSILGIPKELDWSCFNRDHYSRFIDRLRRYLRYRGFEINSVLRYFYCSEYGTDQRYTHRPHHHVLFFVSCPELDVYTLRDVVHQAWNMGRTDKVRPFGAKANYFKAREYRSELAVSNYVAKYVQKISVFQSTIDYRIDAIMRHFYQERFEMFVPEKVHENFDTPLRYLDKYVRHLRFQHVDKFRVEIDEDAYRSFCFSETGKKIRRDLLRVVDQYHNQSKGFGASALFCIDLNEVFENGFLTMPDSQKVVRKIALPKYYERKLFEEVVTFEDGYKCWQKTDLGLLYYRKKLTRVKDFLTDKYTIIKTQYNLDFDVPSLVHYCVNKFGRIKGDIASEIRFSDKVNLPNKWFNYVTPTDKSVLHSCFVSNEYIGGQGVYYSNSLENAIPVKAFIQRYVYRDPKYDNLLEKIASLELETKRQKDEAFRIIQEAKNKKKYLSEFLC